MGYNLIGVYRWIFNKFSFNKYAVFNHSNLEIDTNGAVLQLDYFRLHRYCHLGRCSLNTIVLAQRLNRLSKEDLLHACSKWKVCWYSTYRNHP